jgi:hypothetical protein
MPQAVGPLRTGLAKSGIAEYPRPAQRGIVGTIEAFTLKGTTGCWARPSSLGLLRSTPNRHSPDSGLRGGIKGSYPFDGDYGRFEILSWATKFFLDALMLEESWTGADSMPEAVRD